MANKPSVVLLGTGGPRPDPSRDGPATMIRFGGENLLFDTGRGVVKQLVRAEVPLSEVNPVFITHHHYDHIGDLHDVVLSSWLTGRQQVLRIFGPPDTRRIVNALLTQVYDKDIEFRDQGEPAIGGWKPVEVTEVGAGLVCETPRWRVSAEHVVHGHGLDVPAAFRRRWVCLGYRFECDAGVIAISGDTVDCDGLDRLAKGADVLVQCCYLAEAELTDETTRRLAELTLACGDTVGKIAARAGVGTLVLTHFRRKDAAMLETLAGEIRRDFAGRLVIGADLMAIEL
jgi:ribonuclease Z